MTPLDQAHAAMTDAQGDNRLRLRFFERLGDAELYLVLEREPDGDLVEPRVFDTEGVPLVLVFDRADRLGTFLPEGAPFATLSGRALMPMLADARLGLLLNPEVAPSTFLLDPDGVVWLAQTLERRPQERDMRIAELQPPAGLPDILLTALDQKLASAIGLARMAYLAGTRSEAGAPGHLLGFVDPLPGSEPALAQAINEALAFSGLEAGTLDVAFFASDAALMPQLAKVGLRFDLPQPDLQPPRPAPGSDPDRPPRLR